MLLEDLLLLLSLNSLKLAFVQQFQLSLTHIVSEDRPCWSTAEQPRLESSSNLESNKIFLEYKLLAVFTRAK